MVATPPSHRVDALPDGKVVVRDLELFVGFDETIDDPSNKRIAKYTREQIAQIVAKTQEHIRRGQNPKLILGHNTDGISEYAKPVVGDVPAIRMKDIGSAPGIVGDAVMAREDFEEYLKSNKYPRRSAEIWPDPDNFLSEVALLGSETPARPLPDTRFDRATVLASPDIFARQYPATTFAEPTTTPHAPGAGNVTIPGTPRRRSDDMANDNGDDKKDDTVDQLKAKLKAAMDEIEELKAKQKNQADDDDEKDKAEVSSLRRELKVERYTRLVDQLAAKGFQVGDEKRRKTIVERIAAHEDDREAAAEFEFLKEGMQRVPVEMLVDQRGARTDGDGTAPDPDMRADIVKRVVDRCAVEKKPEMYKQYLAEEYAKAG